jgi:hypothetical protein
MSKLSDIIVKLFRRVLAFNPYLERYDLEPVLA